MRIPIQKILLSVVACLVLSNYVSAQCPDGATAGTPINPVDEGTVICNDGSNQEILENDLTTIGYESVDTYAFIVTAPPNEDGDEELLDVTFDGIFDFSVDSVGLPYLPGEYCFTGFGFNQSQLDDITGNNIVQALINDCVEGGESLDVVLDCIRENPIETGDTTGSVVTVADIDNILNTLVAPLIGYQPCVVFAEPYCVTVTDDVDCGGVGVESINPNSIQAYPNPAQNTTYIEFNTLIPTNVTLELYTMEGRLVQTHTQFAQVGNNRFLVDVSTLATGVYSYKLESEGLSSTKKLIVR